MFSTKRLKRAIQSGLIAVVLVSSAGCTHAYLETRRASLNDLHEGLVYYLPKRVLGVTATRKQVTLAQLNAAVATREAALKAASDAAAAQTIAANQAKAELDALVATASTASRTTLLTAYEVALARKSVLDAAVVRSRAELEQAVQLRNEAVAEPSRLACEYSIKVEELPLIADTSMPLVAKVRHRSWSDDNIDIKIGTNGLLSNGNGTSTDQRLQILEAVAGTVSGLSTGLTSRTLLNLPLGETAAPSCAPGNVTVQGIFDPALSQSITDVQKVLDDAKIPFTVGVNSSTPPTFEWYNSTTEESKTPPTMVPVSGLLYRLDNPVEVVVARKDQPGDRQSRIFSVPQLGPVGFIPYEATVGVTNLTNAVFANGLLTAWKQERPSELAAVLQFPLNAARAVVSVPAELINLRIDYSNANTNLAEAQVLESQALAEQAQLRQCLIAASGVPQAVEACFRP